MTKKAGFRGEKRISRVKKPKILHFYLDKRFPFSIIVSAGHNYLSKEIWEGKSSMATKKATKKAATKKTATKKAATKKTATKKAAATTKKAAGTTKRKPNAAFMKPLTPSAQLAEVVGSSPLPRTQVVKKLWAYIKKNGLQDAKNRRNINADAKLKAVFGKGTVSMFEMTKLVSKHLR
jgi:upstream activation factor subunit UAF30